LISQFPTYRNLESSNAKNLPVAEKITKQVICLPIYPELDLKSVDKVINIIQQNSKQG